MTHLLFNINKGHVFFDGNKRTSLVLSACFLKINDYQDCVVASFMRSMRYVVVWVADNKVKKDLLKDIIEDIITDQPREAVQRVLLGIFRRLLWEIIYHKSGHG